MTHRHLTDEQLTALLAGNAHSDPSNAVLDAHLKACERCRTELAAVKGATLSFNELGLAWAEREAPVRVPAPSWVSLRLGARPSWGMGFAALAVACLAMLGTVPRGLPAGGAESAHTVMATPTNEELAEDNELMQSIGRALQYRSAPAVPASELRAPSRHRAERSGTVVVN